MFENRATSCPSEPSATDNPEDDSPFEGSNISSANCGADEVAVASDGFHVTDESSANWLVRKILEARAYANHVAAWAETENRRAQRDEEQLLQRFGGELELWLRSELNARRARCRFVALPAGRISLRRSAGRIVVADETKALQWATAHLVEAVKMTAIATGEAAIRLQGWCQQEATVFSAPAQLLKSVLTEHVQKTGELPDGVEHQSARDLLLIQ